MYTKGQALFNASLQRVVNFCTSLQRTKTQNSVRSCDLNTLCISKNQICLSYKVECKPVWVEVAGAYNAYSAGVRGKVWLDNKYQVIIRHCELFALVQWLTGGESAYSGLFGFSAGSKHHIGTIKRCLIKTSLRGS